ncbi:MAG TPA: PAS domain S-box protein [Humidesulfovibrio sp.]|uniref:hybrid sensor histidine kinase/response regulator n=1 Tax=Humidesulfovibrio sp. TaxID=2910988 RepID=UPI002B53D6A6|nr:PAS domain S-box protein [Humidesulfovibrio sp.]HWR02477.1 PAS domain S-box protein [Humidesulfovibrio sp.]
MRRLALCLALAGLFLVGAVLPSSALAEKPRKNVLVLNSYHDGYAWSDEIMRGLRAFFTDSQYLVDLQIEYMDTKRFATPERARALYEFYRDKFKGADFDLIIASDDFAYNFILDYQDRLFPGLPVVFCGVNDLKPAKMAGKTNITGLVENVDFEATLRLAARLHPDASRMIVIGDRSVTGMAIQGQLREVAPRLRGILEFEYWDDLPMETILDRLHAMPQNTLLFVIPMYLEHEGKLYAADEVLEVISANVLLPVYSCWRFLLGHGCVGGKLHSGVDHGRMAGSLALRILAGANPGDIPIITRFDDPYAFDYDVLRKLDIPLGALPSGADIINEPYRFYTIDKGLFWTIMVSLAALLFILVLLVASITQRRRIQERVNDQLSFLKILMDAIPLPLYSLTRHGLFQDCNLAFERLFGVSRAAIQGKAPEDIGEPGAGQDVGAAGLRDAVDKELLASAGVRMYESELRLPGQDHRAVMLSKATYLNAKGEILGLVGVLNDISGLKRAQEELRQAEEKYRGIFENSVLGIFRAAPEGNLQDANHALVEMLGFHRLDDLLATGADFLSGDGEGAPNWLSAATGPGGVAAYRREFVRPDGRRITTFLHVRAVAGPDGRLAAYEGVVEDITQRENAERALSKSERMLQLVLDTIPQLVSWKDRDLRYLGVNRSFLSFFGLEDARRVLGRTDEELFEGRESALSAQGQDHAVVDKNQAQYRAAWHTEDGFGRPVLLEVSRVPLHDSGGAVVGLLCAAEDVTEKNNLERQLLQSQKMEAIGTLAGGIAHDFNNILTSIINSAELALMDAPEGTDMAQDLLRVLKAGQRGSQLVRQILAFSRPSQAGFQYVNVAEVARETLSLLSASLPRNISVREDIRQDPALALADPIQLHQVFLNLCTNAFQAMRETGGDLLLTLHAEMLDAQAAEGLSLPPGPYLRLTITDNGPGIEQDILDKIFDPFFTTKGKAEGTGLGLAVVHGIIKAHKGAVAVSSLPWERTSFDIYLPKYERTSRLDSVHPEQVRRGQGRILFVEDDQDQLATIPRVLGKLGYEVTGRSSAPEAMRALDDNPGGFDAVLTDFDMPEVNGVEFARRILTRHPGLPVIMISGRLHTGDIPPDLPPNILRVLAKPYSQAAISEALREILSVG